MLLVMKETVYSTALALEKSLSCLINLVSKKSTERRVMICFKSQMILHAKTEIMAADYDMSINTIIFN